MSLRELLTRGGEIASFCCENAAEVDRNGSFPKKEFSKIAADGLIVAPLARSLGGLGLGFESQSTMHLLRLLRILGKGNLSVGRIYEGHVNGLQLIQTFGHRIQIERFARDAEDQKIFGVWNAEAADGLEFNSLGHKKYELTGSKTFCSGAERCIGSAVCYRQNASFAICDSIFGNPVSTPRLLMLGRSAFLAN
jgi:alkylation response protein AidB-like acyl-CoA dehydrogenase